MDMRTPAPFGAQELWLAQNAGPSIDFEKISRKWRIDFIVLSRNSSAWTLWRIRPNVSYEIVYIDQAFVLLAHQRYVREDKDLIVTSLPVIESIENGLTPTTALVDSKLIRDMRALLEIWPDNQLAQCVRIWILLAQGRVVEAHGIARSLQKRFRRSSVFAYLDGLALARIGDAQGAVDALQSAIRIRPDDMLPYPRLAEILMRQNETRRALQVMNAYQKRSGYAIGANDWLLLAAIRRRMGDYEGAVEAGERALWLVDEGHPQGWRAADEIGLSLLALGEAQDAIRLFEKALNRGAPATEIAFHRALALRALKREKEANAVLSALAREPALSMEVREAVRTQLKKNE
jgi:tetratricopeptide (TPR) repeat protein